MNEKFRLAVILIIIYVLSTVVFGVIVGDAIGGFYSILFTPFNFTTGLQLLVLHSTIMSYLLGIVPVALVVISFLVLQQRRTISYIIGVAASAILGVINCLLFFAMMSV